MRSYCVGMESGTDHSGQLEALYRERFVSFVRIAASITGDVTSAHDAVQDGFARALRSLGTFRGDPLFDAWVWRIVVNAAHDPRPDTREGLHVEPAPPENGSTGEFAAWLALPPERQRLAVFLLYAADFDAADFDYHSIALVLGVMVGTVSRPTGQCRFPRGRAATLAPAAKVCRAGHRRRSRCRQCRDRSRRHCPVPPRP